MSILTISREIGSGGREIAYAVADRLGYRLVTKEVIHEDIRKDGGKWEEWARDLDERCPTIWEKYDWSFRGFGALIQLHILEEAQRDRVVILGRGGNFLLEGIGHALRIRVKASLEMRITRIEKRDSSDRETARWLAEKTDYERSCFIQALYGRSWDDPSAYDMVVDAGSEAIDATVSKIADALTHREALLTEPVKKVLYMRVVSARIKARILTDSSFLVPLLEVFPSGEIVLLRGVVHGAHEHRRIEEAAREVAGDVPVTCELHYRG